jgi:hypothetical protein
MTVLVKYIPMEFAYEAGRAINHLWQQYEGAGLGGSILHRAASFQLRRMVREYEGAYEWGPLGGTVNVVTFPGDNVNYWEMSIWNLAVEEWADHCENLTTDEWWSALAFVAWWNENPWEPPRK